VAHPHSDAREVVSVLDGGIHPGASAGCHPVCCIADEEHTSAAVSLRELRRERERAASFEGDRNRCVADRSADQIAELCIVGVNPTQPPHALKVGIDAPVMHSGSSTSRAFSAASIGDLLTPRMPNVGVGSRSWRISAAGASAATPRWPFERHERVSAQPKLLPCTNSAARPSCPYWRENPRKVRAENGGHNIVKSILVA